MFEGLIDNIGDPLKVSKIIAGTLKDKFLVRSDDDNYGRSVIDPLEFDDWVIDNDISINTPEEIKEAEKQFRKYIRDNRKFVMEDFSGKIVEKLPVYYTQRLEDMDRLSTDFTSSLLAYSSMAVNYSEMNKIIDVMELTRDLIRDRDVQQR